MLSKANLGSITRKTSHTRLHRSKGLCTVRGIFCTCTAQHNPSCICKRPVHNWTGLRLVGMSRRVHSPPQMTLTSPICKVKVVLVLTPALDPTRDLLGILLSWHALIGQLWLEVLFAHCASLQITSSLPYLFLCMCFPVPKANKSSSSESEPLPQLAPQHQYQPFES